MTTGNLEEEAQQAFAEARAEAEGYTSAGGLAIRLDAIENAVLNIARAVDNAWSRLSKPGNE